MEQSDKPLFVFFTLLDKRSGLKQIVNLPGLLYHPSSYIRMYIFSVVPVALDVDNVSCRSIILQKFSLSKVFLLCLIISIAN